jgi:hypothetical protein
MIGGRKSEIGLLFPIFSTFRSWCHQTQQQRWQVGVAFQPIQFYTYSVGGSCVLLLKEAAALGLIWLLLLLFFFLFVMVSRSLYGFLYVFF